MKIEQLSKEELFIKKLRKVGANEVLEMFYKYKNYNIHIIDCINCRVVRIETEQERLVISINTDLPNFNDIFFIATGIKL